MSTPVDRIRRALGFCHRRFWSQKIKDAIKDAASALAELERERDELRAKLAEYENAPTIGVIRDVGSRPYCDWKVSQATLPKSGAEIIARPTRKDGE